MRLMLRPIGSDGLANPKYLCSSERFMEDFKMTPPICAFFSFAPARGWKRGRTGKFGAWKIIRGVFLLCAATAIVAPAQTFTQLHSFDFFTDGADPSAPLVQARDGNFYGTTVGGVNLACPGGCGTVFKITPGGTLTTLHSFNGTDGSNVFAGLASGTDGNFYGTTFDGANLACLDGCGTVFKITPGGTLTTLHSFNGTDGANPEARLVEATDFNLYGTSFTGVGSLFCGTIFKITPGGTLTTLHSFHGPDGCELDAGLVQATDGKFYGTARLGGANRTDCASTGCGTVFKVNHTGTLTRLHSFNGTDGCLLHPGLVQATDGNFYGTTTFCGANGEGTFFKITPGGVLTTLYSFCAQTNCTDGSGPNLLVQGTDGNFYGTTTAGGANSNSLCSIGTVSTCGTIFQITTAGTLTTLYSFCAQTNCTDGFFPMAGLVQGTDGNFYGTTTQGGSSSNCIGGCGTVFSLSVGLGAFVETLPTSGKVGQLVAILGNNLTGSTSVTFNGTPATFTVVQTGAAIKTTVPGGATTGPVQVVTPGGTLTSNVNFLVTP